MVLVLFAGSLSNYIDFSTANAQNNAAGPNILVPGKPVVSMPATNLNIGMDLWNASPATAAAGATKVRPNPSGASSAIVPAAMPEQWIQV